MRKYADESVHFFSEAGRTERENASVREYLKYLGAEFTGDELKVPDTDGDVDVHLPHGEVPER